MMPCEAVPSEIVYPPDKNFMNLWLNFIPVIILNTLDINDLFYIHWTKNWFFKIDKQLVNHVKI